MRVYKVLPWAAWAVMAGTSMEFDAARSAGLGTVCAGAVALAAEARTLGSLSARYGLQSALWGSVALGATTGTVTLLSQDQAVPVVVSAGAALITHILNRDEES